MAQSDHECTSGKKPGAHSLQVTICLVNIKIKTLSCLNYSNATLYLFLLVTKSSPPASWPFEARSSRLKNRRIDPLKRPPICCAPSRPRKIAPVQGITDSWLLPPPVCFSHATPRLFPLYPVPQSLSLPV